MTCTRFPSRTSSCIFTVAQRIQEHEGARRPPELIDLTFLNGKEQSLIKDYLKIIVKKLDGWSADLMKTEAVPGLALANAPGESASSTSPNNFINWCATLPNLPITNGQQLQNGSCNPAPMGAIPAASNMPSAKFVTPVNLDVLPSNTTFLITLAVKNFATGLGHAHVVIQALQSLKQITPTDPTKFAFFVALNGQADANGYLYANVTGGLPEGAYRMSTLMAAANHQGLALPVAKRGADGRYDLLYCRL
ncbi:hypothetical protein JVU11DRAFT_1026 [Chiua virens]|nr:hypothetical protein JVU11DRAFT_1026 [Chiua virens]